MTMILSQAALAAGMLLYLVGIGLVCIGVPIITIWLNIRSFSKREFENELTLKTRIGIVLRNIIYAIVLTITAAGLVLVFFSFFIDLADS